MNTMQPHGNHLTPTTVHSRYAAMKITVEQFKAFEKNTLQGFCDLLLPDVGLRINGATFHRKGNSQWVGMPARSYTEGNETKWTPIVEFANRESREAFQQAAVAAVEAWERDGGSSR